MINEKLHVLFHDLTGAIGGINTLSQICAAYITQFNLEKLEGKFKNEITKNLKNLLAYRKSVGEKFNLVMDTLIEIGERDIAVALQKDVLQEVEKIKDLEAGTDLLYSRLLKDDTKDNLYCFSKEVSEFKTVCDSMMKIITDCRNKLTVLGKY
ncbi:MAG: hypothetical protein WC522_07335 [Candidatus Omnitrophota bacterium]